MALYVQNSFCQTQADTTFNLKGRLIFIDYYGGDTISPFLNSGVAGTPAYLILFENIGTPSYFCYRYFVTQAYGSYGYRIYQSWIGKTYDLVLSMYLNKSASLQICHDRKMDFCNDAHLLRESDNFYLILESIKVASQ